MPYAHYLVIAVFGVIGFFVAAGIFLVVTGNSGGANPRDGSEPSAQLKD